MMLLKDVSDRVVPSLEVRSLVPPACVPPRENKTGSSPNRKTLEKCMKTVDRPATVERMAVAKIHVASSPSVSPCFRSRGGGWPVSLSPGVVPSRPTPAPRGGAVSPNIRAGVAAWGGVSGGKGPSNPPAGRKEGRRGREDAEGDGERAGWSQEEAARGDGKPAKGMRSKDRWTAEKGGRLAEKEADERG